MGALKNILAAAAAKLVPPSGQSYLVVPDKNGTERRVLMDKYYTPNNPPSKALETTSIEYAARLTP